MRLAVRLDIVSVPGPLRVTAVLPVAPMLMRVELPLEFSRIVPLLAIVPSSVVVVPLLSVTVLPLLTVTPLSVAVPLF